MIPCQYGIGKAGPESLMSWSHIPFQLLAPFGSPVRCHVRHPDARQMLELQTRQCTCPRTTLGQLCGDRRWCFLMHGSGFVLLGAMPSVGDVWFNVVAQLSPAEDVVMVCIPSVQPAFCKATRTHLVETDLHWPRHKCLSLSCKMLQV